MRKNLTVIIVTYNSEHIVRDCLKTINFENCDVVIVDNASSDDTTLVIERDFSKVKIIKLQQNIGYGRANNIALNQIKTEFALILNPDAFILEYDINKILSAIASEPDIAIAAPVLLEEFPASTEEISKSLNTVQSNLITKKNNLLYVSYIIGAVVFLRISAFKDLGFYNEDIFLYYEDDEICYKAIQNGYKCAIISDSNAFHIGQSSSKKTFRSTYRRNLHLFLSKLIWKQKRKGLVSTYKSAIRLLIFSFFKSFFYLVCFNEQKLATNLGLTYGCFLYLIRLKPFKKNGVARG